MRRCSVRCGVRVLDRFRQEARQCRVELAALDRLRQIAVHARRETLLVGALHRVCGQGEDWRTPCTVFETQLAIRFLALTGVRTSELRYAIPEQFDLARCLWIISPDRVKQLKVQMRRKRQQPQYVPPYIVLMPIQALEVVRYMLEQFAPGQRYLFPGSWSLQKPISENTLNQALKRMGYDGRLTGHGIRGTISTVLHEIGYPKAWIDAELSHRDSDPTSAPYNHAQYVEQRRVMNAGLGRGPHSAEPSRCPNGRAHRSRPSADS
jgi:integrase